jgi:pimeloyl-ACP methyl ester carboxylesterase
MLEDRPDGMIAGGARAPAIAALIGGRSSIRIVYRGTDMPFMKSVVLRNGVRIPYVEQGNDDGVPLILLHGYTDSWRSFEPVLPLLPRSIHAFAPTQRGHGDADRPESGYAPEDFAADIAAFMDCVGIQSAVIAGHSMGGPIAQRFAIDHPGRTLGLVLMGSIMTLRGNAGMEEFWASGVSKLADPIAPEFAREFQLSTMAHPAPAAFLDTVVQESLKVPARVWRAAFDGMLKIDLSKDLRTISAPTLILWGDRDSVTPASEQDALADAIPGSRIVVYPGIGHALHWDDPDRAAADVATFCAQFAAPTRLPTATGSMKSAAL